MNTYFKIIKAGGMAQVVECLPNKCEALSSSPTPAKKKPAVFQNYAG
jgi:hypothetical protein